VPTYNDTLRRIAAAVPRRRIPESLRPFTKNTRSYFAFIPAFTLMNNSIEYRCARKGTTSNTNTANQAISKSRSRKEKFKWLNNATCSDGCTLCASNHTLGTENNIKVTTRFH